MGIIYDTVFRWFCSVLKIHFKKYRLKSIQSLKNSVFQWQGHLPVINPYFNANVSIQNRAKIQTNDLTSMISHTLMSILRNSVPLMLIKLSLSQNECLRLLERNHGDQELFVFTETGPGGWEMFTYTSTEIQQKPRESQHITHHLPCSRILVLFLDHLILLKILRWFRCYSENKMLTAMMIQQHATYGLLRSPERKRIRSWAAEQFISHMNTQNLHFTHLFSHTSRIFPEICEWKDTC